MNKDFAEAAYTSDNPTKLTPEAEKLKKQILNQRVNQIKVTADTSVADLVEGMAGMSIQARNLGECAQVLKNLYQDKDRPTVFLGLAGPLIAAGLRKVIRDLVVNKAVDVIVSTGAVIYQDIYASFGHGHFVGSPQSDDSELNDLQLDRIYDTYIDEAMVSRTDRFCKLVADEMKPGNYSSRAYIDFLSNRIEDEESIVYQCKKHGVPIFCPALNDSSIGIGLTEHRVRAAEEKREPLVIDSIRDNIELVQLVVKSPKTAAIYVAGGVPKNFINDSIVMGQIYGHERGHDYVIQVTTAVTQDGGLSSSTPSEGRSWGKIEKDAKYAMAWVEPSVSLPLLAGYVFGKKLTNDRSRLKLEWDKNQDLKKL
ncbi:MAG: deoxyhypusine synthase family protein [bacterium]